MRSHGRRVALKQKMSQLRNESSRRPQNGEACDLHGLMLLTDGFGGFGGIAKFNRDFLTALCAHPRVARVTAIPRLMPNEPGPLPDKLEHVCDGLASKRQFVAAAVRKAMELRRIRSSGGSIAIFCGHINYLRIAVVLQRICGGTIHLIIHGIDAWQPTKSPLIKTALRQLDGFLAVSNVTKERFQRWSGLRFDQGVILPNCVDFEAFKPALRSAALAERYGLTESKVLMTLGRLASAERYKGFDEVIELLPRLAQDFPGITYLVCGDGRDRGRLIDKARLLKCDVLDFTRNGGGTTEAKNGELSRPRVIFTGLVSESEKADHYRLADAYVMPSSGEGFGIVYLEALACGVPVIGSKADGSREALREGRLGTLVDPRDPDEICDAIIRVLTGSQGGAPEIKREDLEYFSEECFTHRLHEIIDAIAPAPANDQGVACRQIESAHLP
jgi:glycosyltransferase involved in cell wall biosynthesis